MKFSLLVLLIGCSVSYAGSDTISDTDLVAARAQIKAATTATIFETRISSIPGQVRLDWAGSPAALTGFTTIPSLMAEFKQQRAIYRDAGQTPAARLAALARAVDILAKIQWELN